MGMWTLTAYFLNELSKEFPDKNKEDWKYSELEKYSYCCWIFSKIIFTDE
jgi:hypothetical protein